MFLKVSIYNKKNLAFYYGVYFCFRKKLTIVNYF